MNQTKIDLLALKELFSDPKRYTKEVFARDANNVSVPSTSKDAVCWCLQGGADKVTNLRSGYLLLALAAAIKAIYCHYVSIPSINDNEGLDAVRAVIDKALEMQE